MNRKIRFEVYTAEFFLTLSCKYNRKTYLRLCSLPNVRNIKVY